MARSIKNLQTDFIKFHGCGAYRRDGTNVLCTEIKILLPIQSMLAFG